MLNFSLDEFICPCCKVAHMEKDFLDMLDEARTLAGVPFPINSGWRCPKHNAEEGSTSANHTSGRASDIHCTDGASRIKIVRGLIQADFNRIGIAKTFIHADNMDKIGSPRSIWLYF